MLFLKKQIPSIPHYTHSSMMIVPSGAGIPSGRRLCVKTCALFGGGRNRKDEKEEMFRRQQEILEERRSGSGKSIKAAEERRRKATAEVTLSNTLKYVLLSRRVKRKRRNDWLEKPCHVARNL